jgi:hypothetical protein
VSISAEDPSKFSEVRPGHCEGEMMGYERYTPLFISVPGDNGRFVIFSYLKHNDNFVV